MGPRAHGIVALQGLLARSQQLIAPGHVFSAGLVASRGFGPGALLGDPGVGDWRRGFRSRRGQSRRGGHRVIRGCGCLRAGARRVGARRTGCVARDLLGHRFRFGRPFQHRADELGISQDAGDGDGRTDHPPAPRRVSSLPISGHHRASLLWGNGRKPLRPSDAARVLDVPAVSCVLACSNLTRRPRITSQRNVISFMPGASARAHGAVGAT
jgi:hypothetical protein